MVRILGGDAAAEEVAPTPPVAARTGGGARAKRDRVEAAERGLEPARPSRPSKASLERNHVRPRHLVEWVRAAQEEMTR